MIGLKRHTVRLVDHDPGWATLAAEACQAIRIAGGDLLVEVHHIGSTAIPGLPAKPILDLAAGLRSMEDIPEVIRRLTGIGYIYRGDGGDDGDHLCVKEAPPGIRTIHLHMIEYGGHQWRNYLMFRDRLQQHAELRQQYAELKQRLADEFGQDRKAYTAGKHNFIQEVLHCDAFDRDSY